MIQAFFSFLEAPLFHFGGVAVSWTEIFGFTTGAWCVWLVVKEDVLNWPVGIANNLFFLLLFLHAGLYADSLLQVIFAAIGAYGWWNWLYGGRERSALQVRRASSAELLALLILGGAGTWAVDYLLRAHTNSTVPMWDALILSVSLVATYGQAQKHVESWGFWIAVDLISIPVYVVKGLYLTAFLYGIFLAMCIAGARAWTDELRSHAEALPA